MASTDVSLRLYSEDLIDVAMKRTDVFVLGSTMSGTFEAIRVPVEDRVKALLLQELEWGVNADEEYRRMPSTMHVVVQVRPET